MSASIQYEPQMKQLPCCSCNQANGPCSRSEAPLSAHDAYLYSTEYFQVPTNPPLELSRGLFPEALLATCKTAPGHERHDANDYAVHGFLKLHLCLLTWNAKVKLMKHRHLRTHQVERMLLRTAGITRSLGVLLPRLGAQLPNVRRTSSAFG